MLTVGLGQGWRHQFEFKLIGLISKTLKFFTMTSCRKGSKIVVAGYILWSTGACIALFKPSPVQWNNWNTILNVLETGKKWNEHSFANLTINLYHFRHFWAVYISQQHVCVCFCTTDFWGKRKKVGWWNKPENPQKNPGSTEPAASKKVWSGNLLTVR